MGTFSPANVLCCQLPLPRTIFSVVLKQIFLKSTSMCYLKGLKLKINSPRLPVENHSHIPLYHQRYLGSSWWLGIQTLLQTSPGTFGQNSTRRVPLAPRNETQGATHKCIFLDRGLLQVPIVKGVPVFKGQHGFKGMTIHSNRTQCALAILPVVWVSHPKTPVLGC